MSSNDRLEVVGAGSFSMNAAATVQTRMNLGLQQLLAAKYFAAKVVELEGQNKTFGEVFDELIWLSMATLLNSVAGLESYINEFFVDRASTLPNLPEPAGSTLWELAEMKQTILEKYQLALRLNGADSFPAGRDPFQSVKALIDLRNAAQHFKPEWSHEQKKHAKLSDQLRGHFDGSPLLEDTEPLFPRRWVSASFATWASSRSADFVLEFEMRIGVQRITKHAGRLRGA